MMVNEGYLWLMMVQDRPVKPPSVVVNGRFFCDGSFRLTSGGNSVIAERNGGY